MSLMKWLKRPRQEPDEASLNKHEESTHSHSHNVGSAEGGACAKSTTPIEGTSGSGPDGDCQVVNEEECAATDSSRILEYEHCYSGKTETDKVPENPGGTSKNTVSRGSCARVYRSTWEKEFPWLSTSENQKLFCSLCLLAKMKNAFATTGASNLQHSNIVRHNSSDDHRKAVEADCLRRSLLLKDDSACTNEASSASGESGDIPEPKPVKPSDGVLFNTVLFAAKQVLPNDIVNSLLDLQRHNGAQCRHQDLHSDTVLGIQQSLVAVIDDLLDAELQACAVFSMLCDESTDLSVNKNLIVYVRFTRDGVAQTKLLANVKITDGTAGGITRTLLEVLKQRKLSVTKLVGLGSDGASVMTGRLTGVGVQLAQHAPHVVLIHCMAHRLALVCVDAVKENPYLEEYSSKLGQLYAYFSCSSHRRDNLVRIQEAMNDDKVKLKEPIAVRWLAMYNAVVAVSKTWASLVAVFANDAKAKILGAFITTYTFVAFTALLCDVLEVITDLSKKFQTEAMDVSAVNVHVNIAMAAIQGMNVEPGTCLSTFYETLQLTADVDADGTEATSAWYRGVQLQYSDASEADFLLLRDSYLESVIEGLDERLCSDSTAVLDAFSLLEPQMARSLPDDEVSKLFDLLESHFKAKNASASDDEYSFVNVPALRREFVRLRPLFSGCYSGLRFEGLARMLLLRHRDDFPEACKLAEIGLTMPVSTASCERGFSLQNRIKVKSRTRLLPENLEMLMKLAVAPDLEQFPINRAVAHWYNARRRRLGRLYQPSQRRSAVPLQGQNSTFAIRAFEETEEELVGIDDCYCGDTDDFEFD